MPTVYLQMTSSTDPTNRICQSNAVNDARPQARKHGKLQQQQQPTSVRYLTANCLLLTYFDGDVDSIVNVHFTRALTQTQMAGCFALEDSYDLSTRGRGIYRGMLKQLPAENEDLTATELDQILEEFFNTETIHLNIPPALI